MFSNYTNLYFPICSFVVYLTIFCVFFTKTKVESQETKIYSRLIITGLVESGLYSFICFIAHHIDVDSYYVFYAFLNKAIYSVYVIWFTFLFQYIVLIYDRHHENSKLSIISKPIFIIYDAIMIILIWILNVQIYFDKLIGQSNSYGQSANVLFLAISIYVIVMSIMALLDLKNRNSRSKKYIPFYLLIILMVIALIIRAIDPLFNIYSNILSLVVLVMYFTIENPDVKMAKELAYQKQVAEASSNKTLELLDDMSNDLKSSLHKLESFGNKKISKDNVEALYNEMIEFQKDSIKLSEEITSVLDLATVKGTTEIKEVKYETYDMIDKLKQMIISDNANAINMKVNVSGDIPSVLYGDDSNIIKIVLYFYNYISSIIRDDKLLLDISSMQVGRFSRLKFKFVTSDLSINDHIKEDKDTNRLEFNNSNDINYQIIINLLEKFNGKITIVEKESTTTIELSIDQRLLTEYDILSKREENKNVDIKYKDYSGKRILIVDNNNVKIKELKTLLYPYNVNVLSANSSTQMSEMLSRDETYDMILIDDIIPDFKTSEYYNEFVKSKDGILNIIRMNAKYDITTIIMLNPNTKHLENEYLDYGFNDYIIKPINKENLDKILNKYFDKK